MKRIAVCVGGRPNYIKMAPIVRAIDEAEDLECVLLDAKQHYSPNMRDIFYDEVGLRKPDLCLICGGDGLNQARQTAEAMTQMHYALNGELEGVDAVLVHGDMNYALGCALAAVKLHIPVIHNEAGLRSFDRRMPEEINRILIDHIATTHLVTEQAALTNLSRDGISCPDVVGSTLVESVKYACPEGAADGCTIPRYAVVTLHRPENVDDPGELRKRFAELVEVDKILKIKMIVHPRTRERMLNLESIDTDGIDWQDAVGYGQMLYLMSGASVVITDSGGIQEETTILDIPCLTWRENTERPSTLTYGTNKLVKGSLTDAVDDVLDNPPSGTMPPNWDGKASQRIVEILRRMA